MFSNEIYAGHRRNLKVLVVLVIATAAAYSIAHYYECFQSIYMFLCGHMVVEALRYKPDARRFGSRWCHWNFY
jgi:hypothetical protein